MHDDVCSGWDIRYLPEEDVFAFKKNGQTYYYNDYTNLFSAGKPSLSPMPDREEDRDIRVKILPSNRCNMTCRYCYSAQDRKGNGILLDFEKIANVIESIVESGNGRNIVVTFTGGGEPTLNMPCIRACVAAFNHYAGDVSYSIATNGLFPEDDREFFLSNNFTLGFSLDGTREIRNQHQLRPLSEEAFEQILSNIRFFRDGGSRLFISSVLHKATLLSYRDDMDALIAKTLSFFESLGIRNIFSTFDTDIFYAPFNPQLMDAAAQYCIRAVQWKNAHPEMYLADYQIYTALTHKIHPHDRCATLVEFPHGSLTVLPDGRLTFCHISQSDELACGSIVMSQQENPLMGNPHILELLDETERQRETCVSCIARQTCMSNVCPITFHIYGKNSMKHLCENQRYLRKRILGWMLKSVSDIIEQDCSSN